METGEALTRLHDELESELVENILPYWLQHALDEDNGGFVGRITNENEILHDAAKGSVLNARILWTFSAAYRVVQDPAYRTIADRAFDYFRWRFVDSEHGGVYWALDHTGAPLNTKKHIYAQAFAIYGLSEYARATLDDHARHLALDVFRAVERHGSDPAYGGYFEAFGRDWQAIDDVRLSAKDLNMPKSMNTHLHVLEAYTNLLRVWPSEELRDRLMALLDLFLRVIVDEETDHLLPFFDAEWGPGLHTVSYGHDIEASWLILETADMLRDTDIRVRTSDASLKLARATLAEGLDEDGGLYNEMKPDGSIDTDKHWWPQAEAIVGFVNAYQESGDTEFLSAAVDSWAFIREKIVDAVNGEWFFRVDRDGTPYPEEDKVGLWKCPYHNSRACLEVITRVREMGYV